MKVAESEIERYLTASIKKCSALCFKWQASIRGVPDRIVIINKKVFFVELKTLTGKLSPRQVVVFDDLGEAGFPVHILRSKDDVDDFIKEALKP